MHNGRATLLNYYTYNPEDDLIIDDDLKIN